MTQTIPAPRIAHTLTVGENFIDPLGFHDANPRFSWQLPEGTKKQSAYHIQVKVDGSDAWDSGWVKSDQSTLIPYGGALLQSRQQVEWRIRFRDQGNIESEWSYPAHFEMGLLCNSDWSAQWIRAVENTPQTGPDAPSEPASWLRRSFKLSGPITQARLYVTARGLFELHLNGQRVGEDHFANGWTGYHKRLDTLTYDVTDHLNNDENELQATLGKGWYAGHLGWSNSAGQPEGKYGRNPELLLQLEVRYADGKRQTITSDEQWQGTNDGPILSSSIYDGEDYDARRPVANWQPVLADASLGQARLTPKPFAPVRIIQTVECYEITEPQPGRFIFDFGQNLVGWVRLKFPIQHDQKITLRFAEMLKADGTLYNENYRSAKSVDTYIAARDGTALWDPHFTFHGFRYAELSGLPQGVRPFKNWLKARVLHSDLPRIGTFTSSHSQLNQLQSNIVWGQRGNFVDIPTDCPQRDERMGWTGDAQVFCATSLFNYDSHAFWKSWLGSMRDDQLANGRVPHVVPDILYDGGSPGWMDAATFIPWELYIRTGDIQVLIENYVMMQRLVRWYRSKCVDGLPAKVVGFGDWLEPYAENLKGTTSFDILSGAYYIRSTAILAQTAQLIGRSDDAQRYAQEASAARKVFVERYFDADGKLQNATETQTSYLLAYGFDLVSDELKQKITPHLVRLIRQADTHLRTGFLGTPLLARVLDEAGEGELACELLFKQTYPSWFYPINQGATTMWERWNSYSHENGFGDVGMNSFNHYAYGAIGQWMYERIAGLSPDPAHPGYKHFFIRPLISKQLTSANAQLLTPYGKAASTWELADGKLVINVTVPANTTATIQFPDGRADQTVEAGNHRFESKRQA